MLSIWEKGEGISPKIKRKKPDNRNRQKRSRNSPKESETVQIEESRPRGSKEMNVERRWETMIEDFIKNGNYPFCVIILDIVVLNFIALGIIVFGIECGFVIVGAIVIDVIVIGIAKFVFGIVTFGIVVPCCHFWYCHY
ncbi:hypothetical protein C2G38_2215902 [Gigaspora rosea]|uniref:Uncharacterized protein n=1 Tax=Gigaspora rosea TaxID=44941 RepID=A0A397UDR3_9GLOM|nr:hypothetical protein C2G38_2215902 [Gigaspora rosea]